MRRAENQEISKEKEQRNLIITIEKGLPEE